MSNSVDSPDDSESNFYFVSAIVYAAVIIVGLPLNGVSLWVLLRRHGLKSPSSVLMTNLALSDLLLVLSLPLRVYYYATKSWPFSAQLCVSALILFRNNIRTSSVFITFISMDRLLAVVFPLRSRSLRTTTCAWRACVFVWILIIALSTPESLAIARTLKDNGTTNCLEIRVPALMIVGYIQSITVFVLFGLNVISTVMVTRVLIKKSDVATKANNRLNVVVIFVINLLVFAVFFLPFSVAIMLTTLTSEDSFRRVRATICLASINCCLDPLIYYFSLDAFWRDKDKLSGDTVNS
ncbi:lysophosphatidic acid receptor 5b [Chanos chanos]|uniref:Lysophosphatidic acid receptor 5b n=1 Tax=Chanos chanos TaxID=29144 RepID=A0A6J2VQ12_CHACN|nr:lysophosphatidic acid receptor 4-like [Chanos chanos]